MRLRLHRAPRDLIRIRSVLGQPFSNGDCCSGHIAMFRHLLGAAPSPAFLWRSFITLRIEFLGHQGRLLPVGIVITAGSKHDVHLLWQLLGIEVLLRIQTVMAFGCRCRVRECLIWDWFLLACLLCEWQVLRSHEPPPAIHGRHDSSACIGAQAGKRRALCAPWLALQVENRMHCLFAKTSFRGQHFSGEQAVLTALKPCFKCI